VFVTLIVGNTDISAWDRRFLIAENGVFAKFGSLAVLAK
jgi:hypothetical protein